MNSPEGRRRATRSWFSQAVLGSIALAGFLGFGAGQGAAAGLRADDEEAVVSRKVKRLFAQPPREYATAPLWVWNDLLTEEQIRGTLRDFAEQEVKQVFVHPRPGLMTPYLGPDWFRLWKVALDEASRLDMNVWIYDENSYPSGFAGGWVPEKMPDARGMGIALKETNEVPVWDAESVALFRLTGDAAEDVTARAKAGEAFPPGNRYLLARIVRAGDSPWHGDRCYVNLLTPGVTEKFLEVTLGAYDREVRGEYGKRIPGVFTDEPNIRPAGGLPWCPDLPDRFRQRWGYDLVPNLPSLTKEIGDWRKVRHNYYSTLNELFIERWGKPYYEACERRGLEFTGHYWDHEWPHCVGVPDNMAMAAWQHRPGVDTLMNQYAEHTHAQFGNVRYCREVSSIANQLGRRRTLVEAYGAGGWDLRFEDMKRIGDWLLVLGINTLDQHLSYVTFRGARKRDHPQSFGYQEPWWPAYHTSASYLARLSAALSQGDQFNPVLVLEPTTTAWMYQGNEPKLKELGDKFASLLMALEAAQIEYDLGCEDVIARQGGIGSAAGLAGSWSSQATLKVGKRGYQVVLLPEMTETLDLRTRALLSDLLMAGGQVISLGPPPERTDGRIDPQAMANPTVARQWRQGETREVVSTLRQLMENNEVVVSRAAGDAGILFHHRREWDDGQLLFLVNTSLEHPSRGNVRARLAGLERWDPATGKTEPYPFWETTSGVAAEFDLPPSGSLLLFLSKKPLKPGNPPATDIAWIEAAGAPTIRRAGPNVLTMDYVDVTAGGETRKDQYFYAANRFVWQKNGMERNPWDSAVQFGDELIRREFPPDGGFEASYRFTVEGTVPPDLAIVIERPDLYRITCNGRPVSVDVIRRDRLVTAAGSPPAHGGGFAVEFRDWWMDRAFGRIGIAGVARTGENVVTLQASPFTMWHELEPAYVLGSFRLRATDRGWVIGPDQPLTLESKAPTPSTQPTVPDAKLRSRGGLGWNEQGHPFFAEGMVYRQTFAVNDRSGRFHVALPNWYGAVAKVEVNGKFAGWIGEPPWECDVTSRIRKGDNVVEVTVIGTLKNTLGPHHGNHALGSAWPGMFQNGPAVGPPPGDRYATVAYGIFEPFRLKRIAR